MEWLDKKGRPFKVGDKVFMLCDVARVTREWSIGDAGAGMPYIEGEYALGTRFTRNNPNSLVRGWTYPSDVRVIPPNLETREQILAFLLLDGTDIENE